MQTHGRPGDLRESTGCHHMHIENAYLIRVAAPRELKTKFDPHSRKTHRIEAEVREGRCRCCSGVTATAHPLPSDVVATTTMREGFMVTQPLCHHCANGVARLMMDTCVQPGGIVTGSLVDKIQAASNFVQEREEQRVRFDLDREDRRDRDERHFARKQAALGKTPDIHETLGQLNDDDDDDNASSTAGSEVSASRDDDDDDGESSVGSAEGDAVPIPDVYALSDALDYDSD
jgi:hypothetical protein